MKKITVLILALALAVGMLGCSPKDNEAGADPGVGQFQAGFGEALINPKESVPLAGYGNTSTRMSQNIADDLYVQCVALTDETGNTVLIFSADAIHAGSYMQEGLMKASEETGVPFENMIINGSHSHSAPDGTNSAEESSLRYADYVNMQIVAAAKAALADRKAAQMFYGSSETTGLSFIRHYLMDDGTYGGDSFGDWDNHYAVEHTAEPDTTVHLLKFTREGKKDIVVTNWRCHPGMTGGGGKALNASSDFLGPFRDALEDMADCHAMYLQGHAGNTNPGSRITAEVEYSDYKEHGYQLAACAYEGLKDMRQLETGSVQNKRVILAGKVNHTMDYLAVQASVLSSIWKTTNDRDLVIEQGKPFGIRSPYHANAITNNAKRGETEEVQINVLAIGDSVGITAAPAELFDRNSMALEEASPYEVTLCLGYTNGHLGYIPADYVWEYTSYETDITRFERGTAEIIEQTMLEMLKDLKEGQ